MHHDRRSTYYGRRLSYGRDYRSSYENTYRPSYGRDYLPPYDSNYRPSFERDYRPSYESDYYQPSYGSDGRGYYDTALTFQEPYTNYRSHYGQSSRYDGGYGVVPLEQVYATQEGPYLTNMADYTHQDQYAAYQDDGYNQNQRHKIVELWVPLCCDKCERKVRKHLGQLGGVERITTDQWAQKVTVVGNVRPDFVLRRAQRDKPLTEYWSARHRE